jgi:hypothetical protein
MQIKSCCAIFHCINLNSGSPNWNSLALHHNTVSSHPSDHTHVSHIEKCTKCHGLWFWMVTEYNGLDTSPSCSFDRPDLYVNITQESDTSLIPLAYALGVLCIMVGWACVLKGLLFISRLTDKNTFSATWQLASEQEVPTQNIPAPFWQQIPYRIPWEQTWVNDVRGSK